MFNGISTSPLPGEGRDQPRERGTDGSGQQEQPLAPTVPNPGTVQTLLELIPQGGRESSARGAVQAKSSGLLLQIILAACNNCFPDNVPLLWKCHVGDKRKRFNVTEKFDLGANYFNLREFLAHLHT